MIEDELWVTVETARLQVVLETITTQRVAISTGSGPGGKCVLIVRPATADCHLVPGKNVNIMFGSEITDDAEPQA